MTTYERTLIAHGVSPEAARRDALANELVRLTNREHPAYGQTIYGGGDQAVDMTCSATATAGTQAGRSSALPASTLSPARHLTALPSRQVVGSYNDDELREGFAMKYLGA